MNYTKEQIDFLKSLDFMKLGQAINRGQWQAAAMTMRRLDMKAKEAGMNDFERNFTGDKFILRILKRPCYFFSY